MALNIDEFLKQAARSRAPAAVPAYGAAVGATVSQADDALYRTWRASRSPHDLEALLRSLEPLIQAEVNRRAGSLSRQMLVIQAKKLAVEAVLSYNPAAGTKLSTHVINQLQKLSRVNYAHMHAARIPEHAHLQYHTVNIAVEDFKSEHGREPTSDELADTLRWSPKKVEQFQSQFGRKELIESGDTPADMFVAAQHDPRVDYVYMSLSPRQQKIFEMVTGYRGHKRMSNPEIMRALNLSQGVLSYEKTKLKEAFQKALDHA